MIEGFITWVFHLFQSFGSFGVFLSMFIENIGVPLPTEIGYLVGQGLINEGRATFVEILIIVTIGHISGSILSYLVGLWGENITKKMIKIGKIAETQRKLVIWYKKYGDLAIFLARFVGYIRPWSSFIAGFSEVKFLPFIIWTTIGSLIFNIGVLLFSKSVMIVWDRYVFLHIIIIAVGFCLFFGFLLYEFFLWFKNKYSRVN